jgi:hypothetical protein
MWIIPAVGAVLTSFTAGRCLETAEERNRLLRIFADLNTSTTWPVAPFIASLEKYWGSAG